MLSDGVIPSLHGLNHKFFNGIQRKISSNFKFISLIFSILSNFQPKSLLRVALKWNLENMFRYHTKL